MRIIKPVDPVYKLYKENLKLVYRFTRGIQVPEYCEFDDLDQAGKIGLWQAAINYNPNKEFKFSTYAYYYIKGYILREIYKNLSLLSKVGMHRLSRKDYSKLPTVQSLTSMRQEDGDEFDVDYQLEDKENKIEKIDNKLDYYELKKLFDKFFKSLMPRQKEALELYYFTSGDDGNRLSYRKVGTIMGISPERVRQLLNNGKRALKRYRRHFDVYI